MVDGGVDGGWWMAEWMAEWWVGGRTRKIWRRGEGDLREEGRGVKADEAVASPPPRQNPNR